MTAQTPLDYLDRSGAPHPQISQMIEALEELRNLFSELEQVVVPQSMPEISRLNNELDKFSVRISLIGQVKAGKTALTNGIIGEIGLLPSDVNPWTSAVTSVHINTGKPNKKSAVFKFFNSEEWEGMVESGGRIARLAKNADFEEEFNEIRDRIMDMQDRTKTRLGKNFELLLGNQHAFSQFSSDLIKRYVCLGEEDSLQDRDGRFADLTKSADIYFDSPGFEYPVTVSDTPGVNDPFLVREAVTLDSLGRSHICVIVLSAHQALSTVDLALMRILISLKHEQIVLFINRIDELADPYGQTQEIDGYIRQTLENQGLSPSIPIVFGSAVWAEAKLSGSFDDIPDHSLEALGSLIEGRSGHQRGDQEDPANLFSIDDLSGMRALKRVLDEKAANDIGLPFLHNMALRAADLAQQSALLFGETKPTRGVTVGRLPLEKVVEKIDTLEQHLETTFAEIADSQFDELQFGMVGRYQEFISGESKALLRILSSKKKMAEWAPATEKLRRGLNQEYSGFTVKAHDAVQELNVKTAELITKLYIGLVGADKRKIKIVGPNAEQPSTPMSLMKTMSIDLSSGWLSGWITRKLNKDAYIERFKTITTDEMHQTIAETRKDNVDAYIERSKADLLGFLAQHRKTLISLSELDGDMQRGQLLRELGVADEVDERIFQLEMVLSKLDSMIAQTSEVEEPASVVNQ